MGGKHKQANRTKNNTRPSSSSHSAELLGNTIPTFFGFTTLKNGLSAVPAGIPTDESTYSINSDFQVLFKQMNKKDPITRFKALQQYVDLVNSTEPEEVKAILPLWPRIYCMLCTDVDHKVREISHKAHKAVVSKVKKWIAPYLKELAGPWFTSQYDTYAPAATAATAAFEEAFPSSKLNKAIVFCQEEILSYIYDNLINHTPQTLCNQISISPEDMQAKYERTILASLQGYSLYLQKLSSSQIQDAEDSNKKLLSNPKFWKYAKNKVPQIRSSFFYILISLCQNAKFLLVNDSSRLSSTIFNNLEESDPVVLQSVWDAALNVLVSLEDCWSHINIEKQLCAKLYSLLKAGGRNVSTIYPNILPLLSKIPENAVKDREGLYKNLFDSMRAGFEVIMYTQNSSEGKIMANTFVECLKFVIKQNISKLELCTLLVSNQLLPVLDKTVAGKSKASIKRHLSLQTSLLLQYWHVNRSLDNSVYDQLIVHFFDSLLLVFQNQIKSEITGNLESDILENQIQFINVLLSPEEFLPRNKGRVTFEEEEQEKDDTFETPTERTNKRDFPPELGQFARKLVSTYFTNAVAKEEKNYIIAVTKIVKLFDAKIIFEELMFSTNESTCFKLFSGYFSKWLMRDETKCRELVDLSFILLEYVTDDEKEYILDEFCGNWLTDRLRIDVCRALPNYSHDECIMKWARSEKFSNNLLELIDRAIGGDAGEIDHSDVIVVLLKAKNNKNEFIIEASTAGLIMDVLSKRLELASDKSHGIELSQDLIMNANSSHFSLPSFSKLVSSLFKLSCHKGDSEKLLKTCRTGLEIIMSASQHKVLDFSKDLSDSVREIVLSDKIKYSLERVIENVGMYLKLAESTVNEFQKIIQIVKMFISFNKNDVWNDESIRMLTKCCYIGHESTGILDYEYMRRENYTNLDREDDSDRWEKGGPFDLNVVKKYLRWNLYVGSILNLTFQSHWNEDEIPNHLNKMENMLQETTDFLLSHGLVECFNRYLAGTRYFKNLEDPAKKLKEIASKLLNNLNLSDSKYVYHQCKSMIEKESIWWILKLTFSELFDENIIKSNNSNQDLAEEYFHDFDKLEISKMIANRKNYLMICFAQQEMGHKFTEKQWEQLFVHLYEFFEQFLEKSQFSEKDLLILLAASRLYLQLKIAFRNNHTKPDELRIFSETCLAWNEVVETEIYSKAVAIWRKLAKVLCSKKEIPPEWTIVLQSLGDVVIDGLKTRKWDNANDSLDLAVECARLLRSPLAVIQITSFRLCLSTIPNLVKLDAEVFGNNMSKMFQDGKETSSSNSESTNENWSIKSFESEITGNQSIVETLLSDFIIGDYCTVEPFTDSFTYTYSYLLLWCFLLNACGEAHSSLRVQYGTWLQRAGYTSVVLESIFKLMPQTVLHGSKANENCQKYFENYESLDFREPITGQLIEQMACFVYRLFLNRLPNYVREWWKQTENKKSSIVDNITKLYVSPILISNELKNVQQDKETGFDNIEVKTYPGSREVVATYTIDEVKMDLIMTLPPNYPLGTAKIESSNVVVGTSKWRNLLFQICKYLIHQNGTIWDALVIWKNNLDKKFEGVEECYICFSILQGSSFEIPRLCCHTCKKKFHSNCLYKWFSTSNNSTCPICRNLF